MKNKMSLNLIKPDWIPHKISKITVKKCLASLYSKRVLLNEAHDDIIGCHSWNGTAQTEKK